MFELSGYELHQRFLANVYSAGDICDYFLKRAKRQDGELKAFLSFLDERLYEKARQLDLKRKQGKKLGRLAGVPIAIKDNIHIRHAKTTCASQSLVNYVAPFSATVITLLENEDALIIGKTNLDEFAMGSSTEYSSFYPTKNPWNLSFSPGGSSGGSAAAVGSRSVPIALGTDTGGSIRQPASLCGVYGLKPTYGRISRFGVIPFASSLDHVGPLTHSAKDLAMICEILFRYCPHDPQSSKQESSLFLSN